MTGELRCVRSIIYNIVNEMVQPLDSQPMSLSCGCSLESASWRFSASFELAFIPHIRKSPNKYEAPPPVVTRTASVSETTSLDPRESVTGDPVGSESPSILAESTVG